MVLDQGLTRHVIFTGFLSGVGFDRATEEASVVVMPSIMEETAGLAAMEQMMRGRLVIASDIGGLAEIVDDAGLKFAVGNVDQLVTCMRRVLERRELENEIGIRARRRALGLFAEDRKIKEYLSLYRELLLRFSRTEPQAACDFPFGKSDAWGTSGLQAHDVHS